MEKRCEECDEHFRDNAELALHLQQYHKRPFCGACKKEFDTQEELKHHVIKVHGLTSHV